MVTIFKTIIIVFVRLIWQSKAIILLVYLTRHVLKIQLSHKVKFWGLQAANIVVVLRKPDLWLIREKKIFNRINYELMYSLFITFEQRLAVQWTKYTTNVVPPAPRRRAARPYPTARRTRRSGVSRDATVPRVPIWRHQGLAWTRTSACVRGMETSTKLDKPSRTDVMNGT